MPVGDAPATSPFGDYRDRLHRSLALDRGYLHRHHLGVEMAGKALEALRERPEK
jgi:hypothetical protein